MSLKRYKQFINETLIWDKEEDDFYDMDSGKYLKEMTPDELHDSIYPPKSVQNRMDKYFRKYEPIGYERRLPEKNYKEGEITIEVLRGEDVLRAFNYTGEINTDRMRYSCCNFNLKGGWKNDVNPKWFDFYVKNPDSSGAITLFENGEICGRASFFEGTNLFNNSKIQKGKYYKFSNDSYLYPGHRYEQALNKWLQENDFVKMAHLVGCIFIPYKTRVVNQYPPVDGITVNLKDDILCSSIPRYVPEINPKDYLSAYKLDAGFHCKKLGIKIGYEK